MFENVKNEKPVDVCDGRVECYNQIIPMFDTDRTFLEKLEKLFLSEVAFTLNGSFNK